MVFLMTEIQKGAKAFLQAGIQVGRGLRRRDGDPARRRDRSAGRGHYLLGAVLSAAAGYAGMTVATMANARTTEAAKDGPGKALPIAFRGGAVMGFSVAGLALLGLMLTYIVFVVWLEVDKAFEIVTAYGLGASTIALFSRVGGGIYTKAADVGADLVGKVEAGIPEDDPRNPATIADNVGDNVGDVAGMGADLFESYAGSIIAPISLIAFAGAITAEQRRRRRRSAVLRLPDVRRLHRHDRLDHRLVPRQGRRLDRLQGAQQGPPHGHQRRHGHHRRRRRRWLVLDLRRRRLPSKPWGLAVSVIGGLIVGWALGKTAEYYTSDHFSPVKKIAQQTETGPATTMLKGISTGMVSVAASVALILIGVGVAYWGGQQALGLDEIGGIYGIAVAAIGMLATTGVVVSVDAYGPIADNAGGIAEMAELDPSVREVTDALDSLGNTTAAIAKGFAVGSAALTALALFKSFEFAVADARWRRSLELEHRRDRRLHRSVHRRRAAVPVRGPHDRRRRSCRAADDRRSASSVPRDPGPARRQAGRDPDSARCVAISTDASLKEMIIPGALAVVVPLVVGFISVDALGGLLAGALVTGFALAIFMANAGGAWDNAKKYIEAGHTAARAPSRTRRPSSATPSATRSRTRRARR